MRHALVTVLVALGSLSGTARAQEPVPANEVPIADDPLEFSGYVQPELRYERNGGDDEFYFQVRRGRLKVEYDLSPAGLLLQIDATQDGVEIKDVWGQIALPLPAGMEALVIAGLFKTPFGFDLQHSSSRRVFPERSQMVRNLFPGERDLGLRIDSSFADDLIVAQLAVQNGLPIGDAHFGAFAEPDGDVYKDATLRVAVETGPVTVGASGVYGRGTRFVEDDPMTPMVVEEPYDFPRWAVGGEVRLVLDVPSLGELDIYGELAFARNLARRRDADYPQTSDANVDVLAWYVAAVQSLGEHFAVGARFDQYRVEEEDASNVITAVGMAVPADGVRLVLAYDFHLGDEGGANEGWLRMQVKF